MIEGSGVQTGDARETRMSSTDEIRKQLLIKAPLARGWRAITDAD